jgi:sarcosine oxidase
VVRDFDLIVVGAGIMGCSTAYHAARRGQRVLLVEQFRLGHNRGSSHGSSRIIRLAYPSLDYVRLCQAAYPAWHEVEAELRERLLTTTGGLDFAAPDTPSLERTRSSLRAANLAFDELDRSEIAARFPQFNLANDTVALYQADTAILHADRCLQALATVAQLHGATILEDARVESVRPVAAGVEVGVAGQRYGAGSVAITAGSWLAGLIEPLGLNLPLRVSREQVAYFRALRPEEFAVGRFPVMIAHHTNALFNSGFPMFGSDGVKLMIENKVTARDDSDDIDPIRLAELEQYAHELLPDLGETIQAQTCRYTMTADNDFIVDSHPEHPQIVLVSPCSGHGFKFAALFGGWIADLAQGLPVPELSMFKLDRPTLPATTLKPT